MNAINKPNEVSMFNVNDFVVRTKKSTKPTLWKIVGISNVFKDSFVCNNENEPLVHHFESCELRHATKEEIAAGYRIDQSISPGSEGKTDSLEVLRDCDTSPNCKKYKERIE